MRNILVPWDFTPSSDYALQHAIRLAKDMSLNISLLHVIQTLKEEKSKLESLRKVAIDNQAATGVPTEAIIQQGDLLSTIAEFSSMPDTAMVVMKTDGAKGIQKYTGSNAMKIMRGTKTPFFIVQNSPKPEEIKKIVYPIDFRAESKELLSLITNLIKTYSNPKIYLYKSNTKDKIFKKTINNTVNFAKTLLESKHIEYELETATENVEFSIAVNNYAKSIDADIIVILLPRNLTLTKFLFGVKEQNIITNPYKIPVVCINQKELKVFTGFR